MVVLAQAVAVTTAQLLMELQIQVWAVVAHTQQRQATVVVVSS
jgi:hypothetical protein